MKKYKALDVLKNCKSVCLIAHIDPDPDALSSMVVFRDFLKKQFGIRRVDIFSDCKMISETLQPIIGKVKINKKASKYQTSIMMDCPNTDRLGSYKPLFENCTKKIVIDHHSTNTFCGDINIVENCSSTCEIVYSILKEYSYEISKENQGKLYSGIITDTDNFRVGSITETTFKISSEFNNNINREEIYNHFFANNTYKNMQLLALAINNIVTFEHNQIIISHISHEEARKYRADSDDFIGIVNRIATINTAKLICFIKPKNDNYYVTLRARKGFDVSKIAKINGGGGHVGAAGFISQDPLQIIEQKILNSFRNELKNFKQPNFKLF